MPSRPSSESKTATDSAKLAYYNPEMRLGRHKSKLIVNTGAFEEIAGKVYDKTAANLTGVGPAVKSLKRAAKVVKDTLFPPPMKDIIFSELNDDNINEKLDLTSVETIMQYITKPENETVMKIKQQLAEHNAKLGRDLENSDLSTIAHIIIDYMYSNEVDLSDTSYDEQVLADYFYEKAKKPRPDGLLDPEGVANVAEKEFKARVPQMSIKDFEEGLNSAGLLGILAPIYRESTPYVPYNKMRGDQIAAAMPDAKRIIEAELLKKYNEITKRKLLAEHDRLMALQEANEATASDSESLRELDLIVTGQRAITNESRKQMLAPFIEEQASRIAQEALLELGGDLSGGRKRTHKSKKSRKMKNKKSKKIVKKSSKSKSKKHRK